MDIEPGEQKVFGPTAFGSPSSRCANRIYAVISQRATLAGKRQQQHPQSQSRTKIMTPAGFAGSIPFLCSEIPERRMLRRIRMGCRCKAEERREGYTEVSLR
jgi:hypothetical protein